MRIIAACLAFLSVVAPSRGVPDAAQVARVQQQITEARQEVLQLYGADLDGLSEGVVFPGGPQIRQQLVERFLRAFALGDSFVIAVGGISDVAGHGNYFEEAYPNVCGDALRPVFEAAGVRFQVRNMVDASSQRDIREASVYQTFMLPKLYMKMQYCVSCAVHGRIVRVRKKTLRDSPEGRIYVRPNFGGKGDGKGKGK